jgi:hypothetical protein
MMQPPKIKKKIKKLKLGVSMLLFAIYCHEKLHTGSRNNSIKGDSFPRLKRQAREADHSPPTSAEVKKTWTYTSTPPYVFMA